MNVDTTRYQPPLETLDQRHPCHVCAPDVEQVVAFGGWDKHNFRPRTRRGLNDSEWLVCIYCRGSRKCNSRHESQT